MSNHNVIHQKETSLHPSTKTENAKRIEMSLLGELSLFLGLQISQLKNGIFISQTRFIKEMLKRFNMEECKPVCTPITTCCGEKLPMAQGVPEHNE